MNYWKVEKGNTIDYVKLFKGLVPEDVGVTRIARVPSSVFYRNISKKEK